VAPASVRYYPARWSDDQCQADDEKRDRANTAKRDKTEARYQSNLKGRMLELESRIPGVIEAVKTNLIVEDLADNYVRKGSLSDAQWAYLERMSGEEVARIAEQKKARAAERRKQTRLKKKLEAEHPGAFSAPPFGVASGAIPTVDEVTDEKIRRDLLAYYLDRGRLSPKQSRLLARLMVRHLPDELRQVGPEWTPRDTASFREYLDDQPPYKGTLGGFLTSDRARAAVRRK